MYKFVTIENELQKQENDANRRAISEMKLKGQM